MDKKVKNIFKLLGGILAVIALGVIILVVVLTITEFKPDDVERFLSWQQAQRHKM